MKKLISNKFVRILLNSTKRYAKTSIEILGGRKKPNIIENFYSSIFAFILKNYIKSLGVPWQELKLTLKDPGVAKCFGIVIDSLIKHGLRTPIVLNAPFSIVFNLTNKCNLKCVHCFQKADFNQTDLMTREQKISIIEQLASLGTAAITFSGGEPLMSPDFWECVTTAVKRGIFVSIDTNGTLVDDDIAAKLKKAGVKYAQVSIDSPDPMIHDNFRGIQSAFKLSMKGVTSMKKVGIFVSMGITLTNENVLLIDDFIRLAKEKCFDRIVFYHLIPVGRGINVSNLDLTPKQRSEAIQKLAIIGNVGIEILSETPQYIIETSMISSDLPQKLPSSNCFPITAFFDMNPTKKFFRALKEILGGCPAGRLYANVQPNGDLTPCMFSPFEPVVGNLTKQKFKDAWDGFQIMWDRRNLKGYCGKCQRNVECGGCRARAIIMGDIMGPDYGCYTLRYFMEDNGGYRRNKTGSNNPNRASK